MYRRVFCLGMLTSACTVEITPPGQPEQHNDNSKAPSGSLSEQALGYTNAMRKKYNVPPLVTNLACQNAAQMQAENMAKTGVFKHTISSMGNMATSRQRATLNHVNLPYAENLAYSPYSLDSVFKQWEASSGHLKNLINPKYKRYGLAAVDDPRETKFGQKYYAMVFSG